MQYTPITALSAVIVPDVVMTQGLFIHTPQDTRLYGVTARVGYFFWCRGSGQAMLGTIVPSIAVYLPLHNGLVTSTYTILRIASCEFRCRYLCLSWLCPIAPYFFNPRFLLYERYSLL